jgi:redox-sensitive bicupin YhaK (pirin superfamily)
MKARSNPRPLTGVFAPGPEHWVGDGFLVRTVFWPQRGASAISPFLVLDHGAPREFAPSTDRRGVGEHPHRGFETVTLALSGEIEHRDSAGGGGRIGSGDVQWMTAGGGVVHEERHSTQFAQQGGVFSMLQLWVNLPAADKRCAPRYQALRDASFPRVDLGAAKGRLIGGEYGKQAGPALIHSPLVVMDLLWHEAGLCRLRFPANWTTLLVGVTAGGRVGTEAQDLPEGHFAVFDPGVEGEVACAGQDGTRVLVLAGLPLPDPVVAHGPFVMTTIDEIHEAIEDYHSGAMGHLD